MLLSMVLHYSRAEVVNECWTISTLNFMIKGYLYIKDDLQYHEDGHEVKLGKTYSEERIKFLLLFTFG